LLDTTEGAREVEDSFTGSIMHVRVVKKVAWMEGRMTREGPEG